MEMMTTRKIIKRRIITLKSAGMYGDGNKGLYMTNTSTTINHYRESFVFQYLSTIQMNSVAVEFFQTGFDNFKIVISNLSYADPWRTPA